MPDRANITETGDDTPSYPTEGGLYMSTGPEIREAPAGDGTRRVSPDGFCGRFERCRSSLIEEPEYCEVCRFYRERDSVCAWPERVQE